MAASSAARSTPVCPPERIFTISCLHPPDRHHASCFIMRAAAGRTRMPLLKTLALGFVAGFFAVLIFHQGLWYLLYQVHFIPADRPAWPMDPIPPFGVPSVISKAFWGGLWGAALAPWLVRYRGATYWASWIVIGAVALTLIAPLRGVAAQGPARAGALAALLLCPSGQRRLGLRHRAAIDDAGRAASFSRVERITRLLSRRDWACRGCGSWAAASPGRSPG